MSNWLRKFKRNKAKAIISEFQEMTGWSDLQIVGLCATMKRKTSLDGKVDAIMDVQLKAAEEKFDGAKVATMSANEVIEDAVLIGNK